MHPSPIKTILATIIAILAILTSPTHQQQQLIDKDMLIPNGSTLQTCVDAFVVHRDKIIRTQDSQEMGAKYLNEVDVETRFDCMKWCCETEHCDVFIFEEKKPGSCYLFHCGPPHDFKCKFTSHANYSSAVLTNYNLQNAVALEEQIRRNQQEHELQSLRHVEHPPKEYNNYFTNAPPLASTTPAPAPSTTSTTQPSIKIPACSRNQFECRSSDDCIAIYNVCDGIPQCADGSDEASELGCPIDRTTMPPPPPPPPPQVPQILAAAASPKPYVPLLPDVIRYQQMMQQQHGQYPVVYGNPHSNHEESNKNWPMNNPNLHQLQEMSYNNRMYNQQQQQPDDSILQQQQQQLPINYKPAGYNPWSGYQQGQIYEQNANNKLGNGGIVEMNLDVLHALPQAYERMEEQQPRIFNHKGPGMRVDEVEAPNGIYGQEQINRGYAPYYPGVVHQQVDTWQDPNQAPPNQAQVVTVMPPIEQHHKHQQEQHEHSQSEHEKHGPATSTTPQPCDSAEKLDGASKTQNSSSKDSKKAESNETRKKVQSTATKTDNNGKSSSEHHDSKPASDSAVKDSHKAHEAELRSMSELHQQEHKTLAMTDHVHRHNPKIEDLQMSRPKGAVISLALGLTVTAVMAVLIACRLRVVKRRGRGRGHDSYSHDADYLVNGMYL